MPYIYKITNNINQKIYIGKTIRSINERFREHKRDSFKEECENRPLYRAMRKYGIQNFSVELIEETDNPEERERYWIEYYGSFKNGYNATLGGDGKSYIDYDLVVAAYRELKNCIETAKQLNIHEDTVRNILKIKNEPILSSTEVTKAKYGNCVNMYSLEGKYLMTFASMSEAGQYLIDNKLSNCKLTTIRTHISEACRGKRKTAAKFIWKYVEK